MSDSNGSASLVATLIVAGVCILFPLMGACNVPDAKAKKVSGAVCCGWALNDCTIRSE
jgi:hypothetical protein